MTEEVIKKTFSIGCSAHITSKILTANTDDLNYEQFNDLMMTAQAELIVFLMESFKDAVISIKEHLETKINKEEVKEKIDDAIEHPKVKNPNKKS